MQQFQMENDKIEMSQELMDDALDSMFDDDDEEVNVERITHTIAAYARVLSCAALFFWPSFSLSSSFTLDG